jgi:hypothetical protein
MSSRRIKDRQLDINLIVVGFIIVIFNVRGSEVARSRGRDRRSLAMIRVTDLVLQDVLPEFWSDVFYTCRGSEV